MQKNVSYIYLTEFDFIKYKLKFKKPYTLKLQYNKHRHEVRAKNKALGIDVFETNLDDLPKALYDEIDVLWHEYALCDDQLLTKKSRKLKQNWLKAVDVINAN